MNVKEALKKVERDDEGKRDRDAFIGDLKYPEPGLLELPDYIGRMTDWAYRQMCEYLTIPVRYFRRCPYELQKKQFDYWQREYATKVVMVRSRNHVIRGLVSGSYRPIDNHKVMVELYDRLAGVEIQDLYLDDVKMTIRTMVETGKERLIDGHQVRAGIDVANSEVGHNALTMYPIIVQLVCTNGLIIMKRGEAIFRKVHLGKGGELLDEGLFEAFGEAVEKCPDLTKRHMDYLDESINVLMTAERMIEVAGKESGIPKMLVANVVEELGPKSRAYDFVSALTNKAQNYSLAQRNEIEAAAAKVLERMVA